MGAGFRNLGNLFRDTIVLALLKSCDEHGFSEQTSGILNRVPIYFEQKK